MHKPITRTFIIFAVFAGVMLLLLPMQAFAKTAASAQPISNIFTERPPATPPTVTVTVPMTPTQPITPGLGVNTHVEGEPHCVPVQNGKMCPTFLPIIYGPPFLLLNGRIQLVQELNRVMGLTVFRPKVPGQPITVTLDFSELQFSGLPQSIEWWYSDQSESAAISGGFGETLPITMTMTQNPTLGAQQIMIKFIIAPGIETDPVEFTFFYIPNGDFVDPQGKNAQTQGTTTLWDFTGDNVQISGIPKSRLFLYLNEEAKHSDNTDACEKQAAIGYGTAAIDLQLPADGEFYLHVDGIVYTQDQNPSNNATFDAFEIAINGNVVDRYSNQDQPIRCNPVINRQVVVDARIPLSSYSGNTTISLENYRRFDNQFDTYTEINMVWIDY